MQMLVYFDFKFFKHNFAVLLCHSNILIMLRFLYIIKMLVYNDFNLSIILLFTLPIQYINYAKMFIHNEEANFL